MRPALFHGRSKAFFGFFLLLHFTIALSNSSSNNGGCPVEDLRKCVEPLQQIRLPISKNVVRLLLQIGSPQQLRKSCLAYFSVMPCFHAKVSECGSTAQHEILRQLANALRFLCSPFSVMQQSQLLAHRLCIGRVLGEATEGDCQDGKHSSVLYRCRKQCETRTGTTKFACLIRTWLSEQNLCVLAKMHSECGREAAVFYSQMQKEIFNPKFPVICADDGEAIGDKRRVVGQNGTTTPPSIFVTGKKRSKAVPKLSEVRFKVGGGNTPMKRTTMAMTTTKRNPIVSVTKTTTAAPVMTKKPLAQFTGKSSATTTVLSTKMASPTTTKTPKSSAMLTPSIGPKGSRNSNTTTTVRPSRITPVFSRFVPPSSTPSPKKPTVRRNFTAVNLLVHNLPFVLVPPSALSQMNGSPMNGPLRLPATEKMLFAAAPAWEGIQQEANHKPPFGTRLVFFEVAPIEEIAAFAQRDFEGLGKK